MLRLTILMLSCATLPALADEAAGAAAPGSLAPVVARIKQSVVMVQTWSKDQPSPLLRDPAFARFFGADRAEPKERETAGTAFVVDAAAGLLVTSDYVVRDADRIQVVLPGGELRPATVVGHDEATGVGLLRIAPEGLVALPWSDVEPAAGDPAVLVAHVFKRGPITTVGIVAGSDDSLDGFAIPSLFIDVAVNRGAAGGVIATPEGRVIGMAYGSYGVGSDPYASLGVAVPASEMRPVVEALARDGRVRRGWIGITVTPAVLRRGALIVEVEEGSPAAQAGLEKDQEIVAVNGVAIRDDQPLRRAVARSPVGSKLSLSVLKAEDDVREISITTAERPD